MLFKSYKIIFHQELSDLYDKSEIDAFFYLVLENFHGLKRIDLALNPDMVIDGRSLKKWKKAIKLLKTYMPIQYVLGGTTFCDLPFEVNLDTLIPRPETEELVQFVIMNESKANRRGQKINILDIGTGSGCIAISLAKHIPNSEVVAIDISDKAIEMAKKNAKNNGVSVYFAKANILDLDNSNENEISKLNMGVKFDIIVSNPPYVRHIEKNQISANVINFEPHLALFVEDSDPLIFYRKILELSQNILKTNGTLYFEINQYLGRETCQLLEEYNFKKIHLKKDIYGNDRFIESSIN